MAETVIAPWNLLQIAFIALYPASMSFTRMPSGMTLLAMYVFLFLLCVPPIFIQLKLGNHEQRGIVGLLATYFPLSKGVGIALLVHLFLMCVYMAPLISHYAMYAAISIIQEPYPWGHCDNAWNTPECVSKQQDNKLMTVLQQSNLDMQKEYTSPESQFFNFEYLQVSDNIENISGFPIWQFNKTFENVGIPLTPIALVITWCLIFLFVAFGGRICGWILFILGPGFLSLMFVVMGYGYANLDRGPTNSFLEQLYSLNVEQLTDFSDTTDLITCWICWGFDVLLTYYEQSWTQGFVLVMHSLPVWTAILPTMGKMTGTGKISRNISWLIVVLVYAVTLQLPQLTMAPYMGNLREMSPHIHYKNRTTFGLAFAGGVSSQLLWTVVSVVSLLAEGFSVPFTTMASAFHNLEIPHVYAFLFYLCLYIAGLMSLVLAVFTITDNVVDALSTSVDVFQNRRLCVNFFTAFVLMCLGVGAGILHTTKAGIYYIILMDQCIHKLIFITVTLYGLSLVIVYVRQKIGIAERVIIGIWAGCATVTSSAFFLYCFVSTIDTRPGYLGKKIPDTFDLLCWVLASAPFLAIPAAAIHSYQTAQGSFGKRLRSVCCGQPEDEYEPEPYDYHRPEPSAPPYGETHTYSYVDDNYPMDDVPYSRGYEDPELRPLKASRM